MKVVFLLVRHLGASISTLGSALMLLSFFFPLIVTNSGAISPAASNAEGYLAPEFLVALVIVGTSAPAMFRTVSRSVGWIRGITVLLNIPLFLFLTFIVAFAMSGGSADGGAEIGKAGGEMAGPALSLLGYGVLLSVIGGVISFFTWLGDLLRSTRRHT